jgi:hypothetical protein
VEKLPLYDVDDAFGLASGLVNRSGLSPSWHDREDLVAYLAELAWELSLDYDSRRGPFSTFASIRLRQRTTDWIRQRNGRTVWKFKSHTYIRPRVDLVSLDGGVDRLDESLAARSGDPAADRAPDLGGVFSDGSRQADRHLRTLGLEDAGRASRRA